MSTKVEIKTFNGNRDFSLWKIRIEPQLGVLRSKPALSDFTLTKSILVVKSETKESESEDDETLSKKTEKVPDPIKFEQSDQAKNFIINHITDTVLLKVQHCVTAAELWATLNKLFMESSLPNRIYTQLRLYSFKMVDNLSIDQNTDEFLRIVAELGSLHIQVGEEVQAIMILNSLPPSYIQLKHTLKYGNKTLSVQDVVSSAKSLERELSEQKETIRAPGSTALYTVERGRSHTKNTQGQGKGHGRSNSKSRLTCLFCKKEGHVKKDCYARKRKLENEGKGEVGVITEKLVYSEALSMYDQEAKDKWVIDSGCTYHMTSRMDWFSEFNENETTMILLGDDHTVKLKESGSVKVNTRSGSIRVLKNVRFVPNLRRNLISTGTLDKLGYKHEGGDGKVRFYKENKTALRGDLVNGLYVLDGHTVVNEKCNVEGSNEKIELWHCRRGHMSLNNMKISAEKGLLEKKHIRDLSFCENYVMGKSKKLSFNVGKHITEEVLGYIHADLWGSPNVTPSLSGKHYFLSIIDDKSRKVWLMFRKTKDETFERFCEWKELVENQVNKKVKILQTDNGLEFYNLKFDEFCKQNGIERHRTCTYTPQQNGVTERMNRTLMEKVRCLLNESGLEEVFWAEAAATAAYLVNKSPASAVYHNVPEDLWLDKKPGYKHLRRFGCISYVHLDLGKLKLRALKGVFLGYPQGTKGYKVWLLDEEKCVISRNIVFNESQEYKDIRESSEQPVKDISDSKGYNEFQVSVKEHGECYKTGGVTIEEIDQESDSENTVTQEPLITSIDLSNY